MKVNETRAAGQAETCPAPGGLRRRAAQEYGRAARNSQRRQAS